MTGIKVAGNMVTAYELICAYREGGETAVLWELAKIGAVTAVIVGGVAVGFALGGWAGAGVVATWVTVCEAYPVLRHLAKASYSGAKVGLKAAGQGIKKATGSIKDAAIKARTSYTKSRWAKNECHPLNFVGKYKQKLIQKDLTQAKRIGTATDKGDLHHYGASFGIKGPGKVFKFRLRGRDGNRYNLFKKRGGINNKKGVFEYIKDKEGKITHQRFVKDGIIDDKVGSHMPPVNNLK